jgi:hypothetical protein
MTTIAYKDGIIAYDSQLTRGDMISRIDYDKKKETDNYIFFLGGATCDYDDFIEYIENDQAKRIVDCSGYIFDKQKRKLYACSIEKREDDFVIIKTPIEKETTDAMGTGEQFAIAAMDMGSTAKEAIEYAITRCIYTGGNVRTYILPEYK